MNEQFVPEYCTVSELKYHSNCINQNKQTNRQTNQAGKKKKERKEKEGRKEAELESTSREKIK